MVPEYHNRIVSDVIIERLYSYPIPHFLQDAETCPDKVGFQRCARTDKGVHAARQVINYYSVTIIIMANNLIYPKCCY